MATGPTQIDTYLSGAARVALADAIEEAGGNEVFFVGRPGDADAAIDEVEVFCRGNEHAVPALLNAARHGEVVIHNHPSGRLIPSDPDLALASGFGQDGVGFFIVNNAADALYVVVEPIQGGHAPLDAARVREAFTEQGLGRHIPGYEQRPGQVEMAVAVSEAQNKGHVLVVEAGTGTGKSVAYLLPSVLRAADNGDRVAVATRTIHLQQQLLRGEVPVLRHIEPELRVALLKGRGNYLCLRKLHDRLAAVNSDTEDAAVAFLGDVMRWSEATQDGSHADLPFVPEFDLWESVASNTEHTLRARCAFYDRCFYYQHRRKAAAASILLVNHHLLLADLDLKRQGVGGLLPRYDHVILDEAHHLEDVVTDFAGQQVTTLGLLRHLGRLVPNSARRRGLLMPLRAGLTPELLDTEAGENLARALDEAVDTVDAAHVTVRLALEDVGRAVLGALPMADQRGRDATWRLYDDLQQRAPQIHDQIATAIEGICRTLVQVTRAVERVRDHAGDLEEDFRKRFLQVRMDLATVQRRVTDAGAAMAAVLVVDAQTCRWIEIRKDRHGVPWPRFVVRPIEVAGVVQDALTDNVRSLVLTSATLAVDGSFEHYLARTGLNGPRESERVATLGIASPFDYRRQVLLGLPSDLPEPGRPGYDDEVAHAVAEAVRVVGGRTFVLMTSYRALRQTAGAVERALGPRYTVLRHGDLPRDQLLTSFRDGSHAVLFGTDSFWEGVDVRGEALSCVILPRLPFRVPTEPIQVARAERVKERGGDPFRELSIPQAVIKFKQGFGRLVRHREDRGVVLVLDARVTRRGYGRKFLRSLPDELEPSRGPMSRILRQMERFFD